MKKKQENETQIKLGGDEQKIYIPGYKSKSYNISSIWVNSHKKDKVTKTQGFSTRIMKQMIAYDTDSELKESDSATKNIYN